MSFFFGLILGIIGIYFLFQYRKDVFDILNGAFKCITAQVKFLRKGELVSTEKIADRLKVCSNCPFENNGTCMECGCILVEKARMSTENCPQNYWDKNADNLH